MYNGRGLRALRERWLLVDAGPAAAGRPYGPLLQQRAGVHPEHHLASHRHGLSRGDTDSSRLTERFEAGTQAVAGLVATEKGEWATSTCHSHTRSCRARPDRPRCSTSGSRCRPLRRSTPHSSTSMRVGRASCASSWPRPARCQVLVVSVGAAVYPVAPHLAQPRSRQSKTMTEKVDALAGSVAVVWASSQPVAIAPLTRMDKSSTPTSRSDATQPRRKPSSSAPSPTFTR